MKKISFFDSKGEKEGIDNLNQKSITYTNPLYNTKKDQKKNQDSLSISKNNTSSIKKCNSLIFQLKKTHTQNDSQNYQMQVDIPKHLTFEKLYSKNKNYKTFINMFKPIPNETNKCLTYSKKVDINDYSKIVNTKASFKQKSKNYCDDSIDLFSSRKKSFIMFDPLKDMNNTLNMILDYDIKSSNKLLLSDIKGNLLNGNKLIIDAAGLKGSLRKIRDGYSYFGINQKGNEIMNDYILNFSGCSNKKTVFYIYFDVTKQKFFIDISHDKDITEKNEVMVKEKNLSKRSEKQTYLNLNNQIDFNNILLNFISVKLVGDNFSFKRKKIFFIEKNLLLVEPQTDIGKISIKIYNKSNKESMTKYLFTKKDIISIGNQEGAKIRMESEKDDRIINCTFLFNQNEWFAINYINCFGSSFYSTFSRTDGAINDFKNYASLWMVLDEKLEINQDLYLKISNSIIKISFL